MELVGRRLLVTGGAGFIGSHLAERLLEDNEVVVVDDGSNGRREWVPAAAEFVAGDLGDRAVAAEAVTPDLDGVFHLAAGKAVDDPDPRGQFDSNVEATYTLLEAMREAGVGTLAFASSSTVYGEAPMPTPEAHPPEPISPYGAAKVAEEALCSVYAHSHGLDVSVFRFANVVGPRLQPGSVIVDFIEKLRADPSRLEILGDGRQEKSYLYIDDCVEAMCHVVEHAEGAFVPVNLGTRSTTSVTAIADVVSETLGVDPTYDYTGGDRGWVGDVPRMRLSIERLVGLGFEPARSSDEAVERAAAELAADRGAA